MKETKVYVNKMPKSCVGCKYFAEHRRQCNLELCLQWSEEKFKFNDCPLIDIKTHDRELVKEMCEKIRSELEKELKYDFTSYVPIMNVCNKINRVLDQTQKEYEK